MTQPESAEPACRVRASAESDLPAITAIYAHHVRFGLGSFEEMPPDAAEMERRRAEVLRRGLPYLVAEGPAGAVQGYAYAAPYRARSAYRYSLEDSIYVAPAAERRGIGRALLGELVERCAALGYRQLIAVIGDSGNLGSIGLHERMGFRRVGLLPAAGFKHGRWVDSVLMQRELGDGAATPP
ncbi:MAG TPA: GNAT family N-acetyltransferase [Stellaceae bacterium]|nr:GNAT family N-acetyltransferase [Stellaceae bacterium]